MQFIGCLFILFFLALFLFFHIARTFFLTLFGIRPGQRTAHKGGENERTAREKQKPQEKKKGGRIIPKGEGEYVDFEEIKE